MIKMQLMPHQRSIILATLIKVKSKDMLLEVMRLHIMMKFGTYFTSYVIAAKGDPKSRLMINKGSLLLE